MWHGRLTRSIILTTSLKCHHVRWVNILFHTSHFCFLKTRTVGIWSKVLSKHQTCAQERLQCSNALLMREKVTQPCYIFMEKTSSLGKEGNGFFYHFKPFSSDGKRHVLPISMLLQVKQFVQDNVSSISRQIKTSSPTFTGDLEKTRTPKKKGKRRRGQGSSGALKDGEKSSTGATSGEKKWRADNDRDADVTPSKKRPNYFVAVQVTNAQIRETIQRIQSSILEHSEVDLSSVVEGVHKLHITLMVAHLASKEDVKRASEALERCAVKVREQTKGQAVHLTVEGLEVFNKGRVLFACIKDTDGLNLLHFIADEVARHMEEAGIFSTDKRPFNPHLTLMKFPGQAVAKFRKQGVKGVDESLYQPFLSQAFGSQEVKSLQLCDMQKKGEDGYYFVAHETSFAS